MQKQYTVTRAQSDIGGLFVNIKPCECVLRSILFLIEFPVLRKLMHPLKAFKLRSVPVQTADVVHQFHASLSGTDEPSVIQQNAWTLQYTMALLSHFCHSLNVDDSQSDTEERLASSL